MRKALLLTAVLLMSLSIGIAAQESENQNPIPQGEFAALLASHLSAPEPGGGWNPQNAVGMLQEQSIAPLSGSWDPAGNLTEGDMAHILRAVGIEVYAQEPDAIVTYARAYAVFYRYDERLKDWNLRNVTTGGETTTHVDTGIAASDTVAPASPHTP